jgi:hypothetical protein
MKQTTQVLKTAVALFLVQLLGWQMCFGQVDPWKRITLIKQGRNVAVKLQSGKTLNGKMEGWNPEGLTVRQGKDKVVPVVKSDVAQVAIVSGLSRRSMAASGGLIAGGIGGGLSGAACASLGCGALSVWVGALAFAVVGGIAAGIAALFPPHKEVMYTAAASAPGDSVR